MGFLGTLGGILVFIIILGVIIALHEGGHFFFARRAGILAREFAFGMGPILWKKKKGETLYTIRAFPIGGFCAIAGEEAEDDPFLNQKRVKLDIVDGAVQGIYFDLEGPEKFPIYDIITYDIFDEENTGNLFLQVSDGIEESLFTVKADAMLYVGKQEQQIAPYNRTLDSKSKGARAMVMFGGPLMNFLLAIVVFFIAALINGFPVVEDSKIQIEESSAIYEAGLRNYDKIIKLETADSLISLEIDEWEDVSVFMTNYRESGNLSMIELYYLRDGETKHLSIQPSITLNNLAIETRAHAEGLKIIKYIEANDSMINNSSLSGFIKDEKEVIITAFKYDGVTIDAKDFVAVYKFLNAYEGSRKMAEANQITLELSVDGEVKTVKVTPYSKKVMNYQYKQNGLEVVKVAIGISPVSKFSLGQSLLFPLTQTYKSATAVFSTLGMLFSGDISIKAMSGFVGIASTTVKVTKMGFTSILMWTGLLSVNIGLLNLLPIPALDGGRLVFLAYEAVTKKKPNKKVETWLIVATMLLLFGLMIFVTINDIIKAI